MKRTDGRIPTDMPPYNMDGWMMHETSIEQRQSLWRAAVDTMARYHQLDYQELGFAKLHQLDKTPLQQQLSLLAGLSRLGNGGCRARHWPAGSGLAAGQPADG